MMTFEDFRRLRLAANDCSSAQQLIDEDGGSVDCSDINLLIRQFAAIYSCKTAKDIRALTGLSQAKFSQEYGVSRRTIEDWDAGKRNPPAYVLDMMLFAVISSDSFLDALQ